jgi:hypothetical protein
MLERSETFRQGSTHISSQGLNENLDDMGVGEIVNEMKELGISDDEDERSSDMETLYSSSINGRCSDARSSNTTVDDLEKCGDDSYNKEDPYQHEPYQYDEVKAIAALKAVEREANARDKQELHQGHNVRWVNVKLSEHEGHLTGYRLLLKIRSAIHGHEATITTKPQCADEPFWVSIEVSGPVDNQRGRYGDFGTWEAVLSAAKDIDVVVYVVRDCLLRRMSSFARLMVQTRLCVFILRQKSLRGTLDSERIGMNREL